MNFEFFCRLYNNFLENEFILLNNFYDKKDITSDSKFITLYKNIGSVVYAVNLINKDAINCEYDIICYKCFDKISNLFNSLDNGFKVILLNIIFTENINNNLINFASSFNFEAMEDYNNLCWIIDLISKNIIIPKNQPDKIDNIRYIIESSFDNSNKNDTFIEGNSVFSYVEKNKIKSKEQLKSKNCILSYIIIILNIIVFLFMELNGGSELTKNLIKFGAVEPELILNGHQYYRLFTSMFIHIGIFHLISNSLCLYIFAPKIEMYFGKKYFLLIYIVSGIGAAIFSVLFSKSVSAGASGAIFGLMSAILMYTIMFGKSLGGFSLYLIIIFIIINLSYGFIVDGIDNAGHIGGFILGLIISGFYVKTLKKLKK